MKVYAINGSPRKNGNTVQMCQHFLKGVEESNKQVETELIELSDLNFSGCKSCFACKRIGKTYGACSIKDDLFDVLKKVTLADGILFGSPVYFGDSTGLMRCFLERLLFPFNSYEAGWKKIAPKRMQTAMVYTMNVTEEMFTTKGYRESLAYMEGAIERIFTRPEIIYSFDTLQFSDYSKYHSEVFSEAAKRKRHEEQFPIDCKNAYNAGNRMAEKMLKSV